MSEPAGAGITTVERLWDEHILRRRTMRDCPEHFSKDIWESWRRSRDYGVDPHNRQDFRVDPGAYDRAMEKNRELVDVTTNYVLRLYRHMIGTNHIFQLVSPDGFILKTITADRKILDIINREGLSLLEGSVVTEEVIGTNSSGLCLYLQRPAEVRGAEHYQKENHLFCCISAPIFDGDTMIGCLTLMCPREDDQAFSGGLIRSVVEGIQSEIQMRKTNQEISLTNHLMDIILQSQQDGILLLDRTYHIRYHNEQVIRYLQLEEYDIDGRHLLELVDPKSLPEQIRSQKQGFPQMPLTIINNVGKRCDLTVQMSRSTFEDGEQVYSVSLKPLRESFSLINTVSGSHAAFTFSSMVRTSGIMVKAIDQGIQAAASDSTVLIQGESGTGKELMAQAIHNASSRAGGPFIALNCGAIPRELIASELFGYEAGAFTGASKQGSPGKFELADGGTIFLDEIGDMSFNLQVTLLRVLQNMEVQRLGSKRTRTIDVRVIAATNRDLKQAIRDHTFREDLYYRLNVLNISIPPLRSRREDIRALTRHFITMYNGSLQKSVHDVTEEAMRHLLSYSWPGNVRELENTIERAINFSTSDRITAEDLPEHIVYGEITEPASSFPSEKSAAASAAPAGEYASLVQLLHEHGGNVKKIAEVTDIPLSTLYGKLTRYRLRAKDYKKL
ncbi:MAG: sigma 54-interacting transcriptional regulator [Firmicutes bacterium]|nr:sigma 54-interacting transcriptional regulator [Bacillota bacterium]